MLKELGFKKTAIISKILGQASRNIATKVEKGVSVAAKKAPQVTKSRNLKYSPEAIERTGLGVKQAETTKIAISAELLQRASKAVWSKSRPDGTK